MTWFGRRAAVPSKSDSKGAGGWKGSVANSKSRTWSAIRFRPVLRSDAEQSMDELTLAHRITLCQPADLSFTYRMHRLVAFDRSPGSFRRPESEAVDAVLLDESLVLLNGLITNNQFSVSRV